MQRLAGFLNEDPRAIAEWGMANAAMKECSKRPQALKSYIEADIGNASLAGGEELFCLLNAALSEVFVRSLVECLFEHSQKMITGERGFAGNLIEVERAVVAVVHKLAGAAQPLVHISGGDFGF